MTEFLEVDVCIVGAGPAGTSAAIQARRSGLSCIVIDKATFPRPKCCGDGLTAGALRMLQDLDFDPASVPSWKVVDDVVVSGPSAKPVNYKLPEGPGYFAAVARRTELDHALVQLAKSKGCDIREGVAINGLKADAASVLVSTDSSLSVEAKYLVAADGMYSTVRKLMNLGEPKYRGDWHAFRQYFTNVNPEATSGLYVWFEPDITPGYVWSFPLGDGTANVGFGIQRDNGISIQEMNKLWPDLLSRPHIRAVLGPDAVGEDRHQAWPIPARLGKLAMTGQRVLFVGDAAAATDPMTGEGIGQAIETGIVAVRSIAEGGTEGQVRQRYEQHLSSTMVKDHALAGFLSKMLGNRHVANASVWLTGLTPWTRRNFARWLFEDYPRSVIATPSRWHRKVFTGEGAFTRDTD